MAETSALKLGRLIRSHWRVENQLHWVLGMTFDEDASRIRNGYVAENFSRLCRIALNLLKQVSGKKLSINSKRLRVGWDERYLLETLRA